MYYIRVPYFRKPPNTEKQKEYQQGLRIWGFKVYGLGFKGLGVVGLGFRLYLKSSD